ncbi:unnamed protein product [Pelagomonas calceolata]|uniref:Uncharacterized protein n=1 Tax=Pelagomonas calceolata TaxID=35677 RepID=A0A8J2SZH2_9STRA|nr:unnamed protein product [Pelagomonas calceolata]|mmetsp:Transcript_15753/g.44814  ORF Transcript_15753/g.44814 Transcript_15753/m.44814 type:complete len:223 (-) Transcript_15753:109-777(-)
MPTATRARHCSLRHANVGHQGRGGSSRIGGQRGRGGSRLRRRSSRPRWWASRIACAVSSGAAELVLGLRTDPGRAQRASRMMLIYVMQSSRHRFCSNDPSRDVTGWRYPTVPRWTPFLERSRAITVRRIFSVFFPKGEEISRRPRLRREHCHGTARLAAGNSAGAGRGSSCVLFDFVGMNDGTAAAVAPFCRAATRRASRREWIYQALTALQGNVPAALAEP